MEKKTRLQSHRAIISIVAILFINLLLISFTSAVSPFSNNQQFTQGYDIKYPLIDSIKYNTDYEFNFHVFNISDGLPVTTSVTCYFHLYNYTGEHQLEMTDSVVSHTFDYEFYIIGSNFTDIGKEYYWNFQCDGVTGQGGSKFGGYAEGSFIVTSSGLIQNSSQGIASFSYLLLMIVLMFSFTFIGFKLSKTEYWWILGVFFIFLSALLLIYNTWLGYEYHRTLTGFADSSIPEIIFYIFLLILVLGLLASLILLFLHWKKVFKYIKREIKRQPKEDRDVEDWNFKEFDER
jgi:hypothetical protein